MEASPVQFVMQDGKVVGQAIGDETRIEPGELLGYRCTSCGAEFTSPAAAAV